MDYVQNPSGELVSPAEHLFNTYVWGPASAADDCTPLVLPRTIGLGASAQISGTWNGATAELQVSNDGVTWFTLSDVQGFEVSKTANALVEISTSAIYLKPVITGGDGSTALTFTVNMVG